MSTLFSPAYVDGSPSDGHKAPAVVRYAHANANERRLIRVTLALALHALEENRHLVEVLAPAFALVLIDVPDPREPERSTLPDRVVVALDKHGKVIRSQGGLPCPVQRCVRAILKDAERFKSLRSRWMAQSLRSASTSSEAVEAADGHPRRVGPRTVPSTSDSERLQFLGLLVHPKQARIEIRPSSDSYAIDVIADGRSGSAILYGATGATLGEAIDRVASRRFPNGQEQPYTPSITDPRLAILSASITPSSSSAAPPAPAPSAS
jgi:hypothetical protein